MSPLAQQVAAIVGEPVGEAVGFADFRVLVTPTDKRVTIVERGALIDEIRLDAQPRWWPIGGICQIAPDRCGFSPDDLRRVWNVPFDHRRLYIDSGVLIVTVDGAGQPGQWPLDGEIEFKLDLMCDA